MVFLLIVLTFLVSSERSSGKLEADDRFLGREDMVKWAGYGEEKLSTVEIGGKLLCHARPVSGATMAIVCVKSTTTALKKKSWATKGTTDSSGSFLIDLPSQLHAIRNLEEACHVEVVRLSKTSPCNSSRKHEAIRLTSSSVDEGVRSYTTNDVELMPNKRT